MAVFVEGRGVRLRVHDLGDRGLEGATAKQCAANVAIGGSSQKLAAGINHERNLLGPGIDCRNGVTNVGRRQHA